MGVLWRYGIAVGVDKKGWRRRKASLWGPAAQKGDESFGVLLTDGDGARPRLAFQGVKRLHLPICHPLDPDLAYAGSADGLLELNLRNGKVQRVVKPGVTTWWLKLSPDGKYAGTKLLHNSNVLARCELLMTVLRLPRAPTGVRTAWTDAGCRITWTAPAYHQEIKGYHVYRSDESGRGFRLLAGTCLDGYPKLTWAGTPDRRSSHYNLYSSTSPDFRPGRDTLIAAPDAAAYLDWQALPGRSFYKVMQVTRDGLESEPSNEVSIEPRHQAGR